MDALVDLEIAELELLAEQQNHTLETDNLVPELEFTFFENTSSHSDTALDIDPFEQIWLDVILKNDAPATVPTKSGENPLFTIDDGGYNDLFSTFDILTEDDDEIIVTGTKNGDPWTTSVSQEFLNTLGITIEEYLFGSNWNLADGVTDIQIPRTGDGTILTGDEAQDFLDRLYEEADEGTIDITTTTETEVTVVTDGVTITSCIETPIGCFQIFFVGNTLILIYIFTFQL